MGTKSKSQAYKEHVFSVESLVRSDQQKGELVPVKYERRPILLSIVESGQFGDMIPETVAQAVASAGCQQISTIKRNDSDYLDLALVKIFTSFGETFNISGTMAGVCARQVKKQYWYLTLEEILYVLTKGISGHYGMIGRGISPILQWLRLYDEGERAEYCEAKAMEQKEGFEKQFDQMEREANRGKKVKLGEAIQREKNFRLAKEIVDGQERANNVTTTKK